MNMTPERLAKLKEEYEALNIPAERAKDYWYNWATGQWAVLEV